MNSPKAVNWLPKHSKRNVKAMDKWFKGLKRPMFSVVIGTYKQAHILPKVLKGWEDQEYADGFEVFLCDDASSDGTKKWAENYAKKTPLQFKYLRIKKRAEPGCLAKNLNQALPYMQGHYAIFCMGDTVPQDGTLTQYAKHLGGNRVLCGLRKNVNEKMEFLSMDWRFEGRREVQKKDIISVTDEAPWAAITGNGLVVPVWALKEIGGWHEGYPGWGCDDYDLALRLYELGLEFYLTPQAVVLHIDHPQQEESVANTNLFQKRLGSYKRRVREGIKTIVLDFDDLSPSNNGLFYFKKLKEHFPKMKVSLFTIPFKTVGQNREKVEFWPQNADLVKEINSLDWIEIIPHGLFHVPAELQNISYDNMILTVKAIEEHFNQLDFNWKRGMKAPHWQIGTEAMRALRDIGYFLAINPDDELKMKIPKGLRTYKHNWGIQFPIPRGKTELRGHGHIQNWQGTGLSANFINLLDLPTTAEWKFVSECLPSRKNINTVAYWNMSHKTSLRGLDMSKSYWAEARKRRKQVIVKQIPKGSKKIIDLGCGFGTLCNLVKGKFPKAEVWGVDFSDVAVEKNKKKYPNIHFILGDVRKKLPLTEKFDVVMSEELWEHLEDPGDLAKSTIQLLRSGGKFIFILPFANTIQSPEHIREYGVRDVEKILAEFKELAEVNVERVVDKFFILVTGIKKGEK